MNLDIMRELLAIAGRLDEKGLAKEADVIDRIVKSAYPGEQSFWSMDRSSLGGGGEVATLDGPIIPEGSPIEGARERFLASTQAPEGRIKPHGDPYTYDYDYDNDVFIIATAPVNKYYLVGKKLKRGTSAYETLSEEPSVKDEVERRNQQRLSTIDPLFPSEEMRDEAGNPYLTHVATKLLDNIGPGLTVHLKKSDNQAYNPLMQDDIARQLKKEIETQMLASPINKVNRAALAEFVRSLDLNNVSKARIIGYFDPVTEGSSQVR